MPSFVTETMSNTPPQFETKEDTQVSTALAAEESNAAVPSLPNHPTLPPLPPVHPNDASVKRVTDEQAVKSFHPPRQHR